jgi:hypothetical protein
MAAVGALALTLADWAKRKDPDGKTAKVVEQLNETNEILDDMLWVEGNLPTGHRSTIRSGLPTVTWRLLNYGVPNSKSRTQQVTDTIGMLETYSEIDEDIVNLNGNTADFRASEDAPFLESMSQEQAGTLFYGNTETDPEQYVGLAPRFDLTTAGNGGQIILGGGTTESQNTSIWLVIWGPNTCFGIFPKGSKAGLKATDKGVVTLTDAAGGQYEGYRMHYKWNAGLVVKDWRYVVRIPNIDPSVLTKNAATGPDIVDLMTQALEIPPNLQGGKPIFYCNRTIKSFLRRQIKNSNNVNITQDEVAGKHVLAFDGVPVRKCDQILSTEALVS